MCLIPVAPVVSCLTSCDQEHVLCVRVATVLRSRHVEPVVVVVPYSESSSCVLTQRAATSCYLGSHSSPLKNLLEKHTNMKLSHDRVVMSDVTDLSEPSLASSLFQASSSSTAP